MTAMLQHFESPYDWSAIDAAVTQAGAVVLNGYLSQPFLDSLNEEIDHYLGADHERGIPTTDSASYNKFLGFNTLRLHGLAAKFPTTVELLGDASVIDWASRMIAPRASSVVLNAGEFIQIQPGEPRQFIHRDTDSWPVERRNAPVVVNAIYALDGDSRELRVARRATGEGS